MRGPPEESQTSAVDHVVMETPPEVVASVQENYKSESLSTQPKGRPKSGRTWKTEQRQSFSTLVFESQKGQKFTIVLEMEMDEKARLKSLKAYENELKAARREEFEKLKKKRIAKKKRQEENERKSEVVQVIKNTAKIKRMKKKQLRQLEKR
ncbi:putative coiled-coil domain-containing protein [Apostichopus japonicus]|uniref:Coiled-coil domain-containing protein 86 n=1 Tax=Stichopus japonicus TaxID=307972 RepID=A0A2G8LJX5_STIJA|nr:putative coiled-coil domain-containing protein [Apostichopus japonicus]